MRILGSMLFLALVLFADFRVYLEQNSLSMGEPARLHIEASGDEVVLPKLSKVGPYPVAGITQSESVVKSGPKLEVRKSMVVTFYPDQNFTIPSLVATIDGQEVRSEPIDVVVKRATKSRDILFELQVNKKEAYVGEPIVAQLILRIKRTLNIVDYDFIPPKFENFWVKELKSSNKYLEEHGSYLIKRIKFLLFPQKSGKLHITPAIFKFAVPDRTTDMFGFSITAPRWRSVASNGVDIVVKPLPKPVDLVGDFKLSVKVDKKRVKPNEPVNLQVVITGEGNVENLDSIELNISNATVYADKPKIKEDLRQGKLYATWSQSFSLIASESFTIPSLVFEYFSLKDKSIKRMESKPIAIEVLGAVAKPKESKKSKDVAVVQQQKGFSWFGFGIGFVSGLLVALLARFLPKKEKRLWRIKDKRALLAKLLPHISKSPKIASLAEALYREIYQGERSKIKAKDVEEALKDLV